MPAIKFILAYSITFLCFFQQVRSQEIRIDLGAEKIGQNQTYEITLTAENGRIEKYSAFPNIPGFSKLGTSSSQNTTIRNGRVSSSQSITQNYSPNSQGTFVIKPFSIVVNGTEVNSGGGKVVVTAPVQQQRRQSWDPFADLFGRDQQPQEYVDIEADGFFSVSATKDDVYVGEGFTLDISFYESYQNKAKLNFYKLQEQLDKVIEKVRPQNCWEENFQIQQVIPVAVRINDKSYKKYTLYQAVFYPLNTNTITIPSTSFQLVKYKQARRRSFFGNNYEEELVTFRSPGKTVKVKDLPPHPRKDLVSVGEYRKRERLSDGPYETGKSISYTMQIEGEGNIASMEPPSINSTENLVVYDPAVTMSIRRDKGRVTGNKNFQYYLESKEPGTYTLSEQIKFIYFDPSREIYDTLTPSPILKIEGESLKNQILANNEIRDSFYDRIQTSDTKLTPIEKPDFMRWALNIFAVLSMAVVLFFSLKGSK